MIRRSGYGIALAMTYELAMPRGVKSIPVKVEMPSMLRPRPAVRGGVNTSPNIPGPHLVGLTHDRQQSLRTATISP